jgi:hypothetical protein
MLIVTLVFQALNVLDFSHNDLQIPDNGPVLRGMGAQVQGTPSPLPTPTGTSSSSHLVSNGYFVVLAAAFSLMMV